MTGSYSSVIPLSTTDAVKTKLLDNLSATHCMKDSKCEATVSLTSHSDIPTELILILSVALTSRVDLDINGYLSSGLRKEITLFVKLILRQLMKMTLNL